MFSALNDNNNLHYIFAHQVIPLLVFEKTKDFYRGLNQMHCTEYVQNIWYSLAKKLKIANPTGRPSCGQSFPIDKNCYGHIIQMPYARTIPEAEIIGIVFWIKSGLFQESITRVRYFALELDSDFNNPSYVLGEWTSPKNHVNYGRLKDVNQPTFVNAIRSLVLNDAIPQDLRSTQKATTPSAVFTPSTADFMMRTEKGEEALKAISDKWLSIVPPELIMEALKATREVNKACSFLNIGMRQNGLAADETYKKQKEVIKKTVNGLAVESLLIGVDCGADAKIHLDHIPEDANRLLKIAGEPTAMLIAYFVDELKKATKHESNLDAHFNRIIDAQEKCFTIGLRYAEQLRLPTAPSPEESHDDNQTYKDLLDVALFDSDPDVRQQAQEGVRELYPGGPQAFENWLYKLVEGLRDPGKRSMSESMLPLYGEMALPYLRPYLKDPDPTMRQIVTKIIIEIEKNRPK